MAYRDIILIGGSAGGVQALSELVGGFPADLPAAVFIVLHISPYGRSAMPVILSRTGGLPAALAKQDDVVEAALWAAVRSLLENAALARRVERRLGQSARLSPIAEQRYERRAEEAERHAEVLRRMLVMDKVKARAS